MHHPISHILNIIFTFSQRFNLASCFNQSHEHEIMVPYFAAGRWKKVYQHKGLGCFGLDLFTYLKPVAKSSTYLLETMLYSMDTICQHSRELPISRKICFDLFGLCFQKDRYCTKNTALAQHKKNRSSINGTIVEICKVSSCCRSYLNLAHICTQNNILKIPMVKFNSSVQDMNTG